MPAAEGAQGAPPSMAPSPDGTGPQETRCRRCSGLCLFQFDHDLFIAHLFRIPRQCFHVTSTSPRGDFLGRRTISCNFIWSVRTQCVIMGRASEIQNFRPGGATCRYHRIQQPGESGRWPRGCPETGVKSSHSRSSWDTSAHGKSILEKAFSRGRDIAPWYLHLKIPDNRARARDCGHLVDQF